MIEFAFVHGLISYKTFKNYLKYCPHLPQKESFLKDFVDDNDISYIHYYYDDIFPMNNVTYKCNDIRIEIYLALYGINIYGIHKECPDYDSMFKYKNKFTNINIEQSYLHSYKYRFAKMLKNEETDMKKIKNLRNAKLNDLNEELEYEINFLPYCGYTERDLLIDDFWNNNSTKRKLGVDESIEYQQCADLIYKWGESTNFYVNKLKDLSDNGFKSWIFSGTEDIAVATLGTLRWINYNNFTIDETWEQWIEDEQVLGMKQRYTNGLTILTVIGAGHMVPEDKPESAKKMLDKYIKSDK